MIHHKKKIKALIFDFDGVILDTETPDLRAWQSIFTQFNCPFPTEAFMKGVGAVELFDPYSYIKKYATVTVSKDDVMNAWNKQFHELVSKEEASPGLIKLLSTSHDFGLKVAIASNSSHKWIKQHLSRLSIMSFFDCIKSRHDIDVINGKPAPDVYKAVLDKLCLSPKEAIAFEDSPNGIHSAKSAGLYCIAVPNQVTRELPLDEADACFHSLESLDIKRLILE